VISDEMERPVDARDVNSPTNRLIVRRIRELLHVAFSGDRVKNIFLSPIIK